MHYVLLIASGCTLLSGCARQQIHEPLPGASVRATPLSFGMYVTPDPLQNPIDPPERFTGFHTAVDYEVSSGEVDGDVPVYALCSGRVVFSGYVEGYGGTVAHRCRLEDGDVTVLYGHLDLEGLPKQRSNLRGGDTIGLLAPPQSYASGYTRKHLHLSIHKGTDLVFAGYVEHEEDLERYIDPQEVLRDTTIDIPIDQPGEVPYWQAP